MILSLFLAQLLGIFLTVTCASALFNHKLVSRLIKELSENYTLIIFSGFVSLLVGLLLVLLHNVWTYDWRVLITLIGWLAVVKGIARLFFPDKVLKIAARVSLNFYLIICAVFLLIGVYLTYIGFSF